MTIFAEGNDFDENRIAVESHYAIVPDEWKNPVTGIKSVSPQEARYYRSVFPYSRQRKMTPKLSAEYSRLMKEGNFAPLSDIFFGYYADDPTGQRYYLIDGNHTSEAIAALDFIFNNIMIKVFPCKSMEEVNRLYINLGGGKKRTLADALRADGITSEMKNAKSFVAAFNACLLSFHQRNDAVYRGTIENITLLYKTAQLCALANDIFDKSSEIKPMERILKRSHILAIMLATLKYQPDKAYEFWQQIASNDGLRIGTPQHTLHTYLLTDKKVISAEAVKKDKRGIEARAAARAWNAFYDDQPLKQLNIKSWSLIIKGTPWEKEKSIADVDISLLFDDLIVD